MVRFSAYLMAMASGGILAARLSWIACAGLASV
jgi:hypothetical protein